MKNIADATRELSSRLSHLELDSGLHQTLAEGGSGLMAQIEDEVTVAALAHDTPGVNASASGLDKHIVGAQHRLSKGSLFDLAVEAFLMVGAFASVLSLSPAAIAGLGVFLYRYRRNSTDVDEWDALVLKALVDSASSKGLSPAAVRDALPVNDDDRPPLEEVVRRLNRLRSLRLRNGETVSVLDEADGLWWAKDI